VQVKRQLGLRNAGDGRAEFLYGNTSTIQGDPSQCEPCARRENIQKSMGVESWHFQLKKEQITKVRKLLIPVAAV